MRNVMEKLLLEYSEKVKKIYGKDLQAVILYGSYARGDFTKDSDIDIMILLNMDELQIKKYRHQLSEMTYDFNMEYNVDVKPIAKSMEIFTRWKAVYPFYENIQKEGVTLYHAA